MNEFFDGTKSPAPTQRIITACVLIHQFGGVKKVLLARRAMAKKFRPGKYELPGGHVGYDEDIAKALRRVVLGELGVHLIVGDPFAAFGYINQARRAHSVKVVYFATLLDPPEQIALRMKDHSECRWFSRDQLNLAEYEHDNPELAAITQAFALLDGRTINFGLAV